MRDVVEDIFGTDKIYNPEVVELLRWARDENNRIRKYKMIKIAKKLEDNYESSINILLWFIGIHKETNFTIEVSFRKLNYTKVKNVVR